MKLNRIKKELKKLLNRKVAKKDISNHKLYKRSTRRLNIALKEITNLESVLKSIDKVK